MEDNKKKGLFMPQEIIDDDRLNIYEIMLLSYYKYYTEYGKLKCCKKTNDVIIGELKKMSRCTFYRVKSHLEDLGLIRTDGGIKVYYTGKYGQQNKTEDCHRETEESHRETEESHRETEDCHRETEDCHRETEESHRETEESHRETEESHRETEESHRETEESHRETHNKEKKEEKKEEIKEEKIPGPEFGPGPIEDNKELNKTEMKEAPETNFDKIISKLDSYHREGEKINYIKDNFSDKINIINKAKEDELNISMWVSQITYLIDKQFGTEEYIPKEIHRDKRNGMTQLEDQFSGFCYLGEDAFDNISKSIAPPKETIDDRFL
jgi:hypothetical protein